MIVEYAEQAERPGVLVVPAEEQRELEDVRDRRDRPGHHRRDRRNEDVAVLDVRELVREHAPDLVGRQVLQQPLRHRDRSVLRVPAGREGVRLLGRDQEQPRPRDPRPLREVLHDPLELRHRAGLERLCPARLQREPVREPVAGDVHEDGEADEEVERAAADQRADRDQQAGQPRDQQPRTGLGGEASRCDVHLFRVSFRLSAVVDDQPKVSPATRAGVPGLDEPY
jgi:hypothetical protein